MTVIVAPVDPADQAADDESPRVFYAADELAAALGAASGAEVAVIEGTLADAPAEGYLVAFAAPGLADHADKARRIVLVNADGGTVRGHLERLGLAGAIERNRYFRWQHSRDRETGGGVIGRKDLAAAIGATTTSSHETERYATLESTRYADLPALLVAYLRAHADRQVAS
jgi:hypothetical protein